MPELDKRVSEVFAGKVVRKDLVRQVKVGANVPTYVLEYLLGKYCATDDPVAVEAGLRMVNSASAISTTAVFSAGVSTRASRFVLYMFVLHLHP